MFEAAAAQAIGTAVGPTSEAGKGIYQFLKRKYNYVKNLDNNLCALQTAANRLYDKESDIKQVLELNKDRKQLTHVCETWLGEVNTLRGEISNLLTRYNDIRKYLCGLCPFIGLLRLGKDVLKKTTEAVNLANRMDLDNRAIVVQQKPQIVEFKYVTKINDVPSLYENVKKLLQYLEDKEVSRIGIWGGLGVGKTMVMKNLNNELGKSNMFDIVIWVTVSKDGGSIGKLQKVLAERLQLNLEGINTEHQVANLISKALEKKRYLLLFDEVFSEINLCDVGVYLRTEDVHYGHKHGKVVVASRSKFVCTLMCVDEYFEVKRLSKNDVWELFMRNVGDAANHPRIKDVASQVLKECGGLPQLIKAVAIMLKNEYNLALWNNTLAKLQTNSGLQEIEEAFAVFQLACNKLDVDRKDCVLYGALFPEDHDIYREYLIECWSAEEFIRRDCRDFRKTLDEGHGILNDLINTSLFEEGKNSEHVKMIPIFRKMALRIINSSNDVLVRSGDENDTTYPHIGEWRRAKRISLMCNELQALPDRPECCTTSTLFLQMNKTLSSIPDSFFAYMCGLRVLDLCKTTIKTLPMSMSNLVDLRVLYLNHCSNLEELPPELAELKNLDVLDIRRTGIRSLPIVIGELVSLKCLRVSFVASTTPQRMIIIPRNLIVKLSQLEELSIDVDPDEQSWNEIVHDIAQEVANLRILTTLHFYFPILNCFEAFIKKRESWNKSKSSSSFRSFRILVGSHQTRHTHELSVPENFANNEGHLRFSGGEAIPDAILKVLDQVTIFELIGHRNIQSLSKFGMDKIRGLKICIVKECNEMKSIIKSNTLTIAAFPYLEQLYMINLLKLEHISNGLLEPGSLRKLTTLKVYGCPELKTIFPKEMTRHLSKLEILTVNNCSQIEHVIEYDDYDQSVGLPELKILELVSLPALVSIYPIDALKWPALEKVEIRDCDTLKKLTLIKENASRLRRIGCNRAWWDALEWQNDAVKDSLQIVCNFS